MGLNADIREIALDAAREVLRAEVERLREAAAAPERPGLEPLLTVAEVARLCRVSTKTVQRWIGKGLIKGTRCPGMREYRISRRDYEAFALGPPVPSSVDAPKDLEAEAERVVSAALSRGRRAR